MLKCSVKIDEKLQKEINEKLWITSLICTIIGAIGLGCYVVLGVFFESVWLEVVLWTMACLFGFGVVYLITINKINKKAAQNNNVDEYEIYETYINATTIRNNETISTLKIYYKDIIKMRETENYLLLYVNKASVIPIPKQSFSPEEYSTIKLWVNSAKLKKD